jgi:hypothetical protein
MTADVHSMLSTVEEVAWVHVLDAASTFPDVLNISASQWLPLLPHHERSILAVAMQNEHHAYVNYQHAAGMHGQDSAQAIDAADNLKAREQTKTSTVQALVATVTSLLSVNLND